MGSKTRARIVVTGRVQGVYFRMATRQAATRFGVSGWVRNRADGTVEALLEGDETDVDATIDWCRTGPPGARVQRVDVDWEAYEGESETFEIRY